MPLRGLGCIGHWGGQRAVPAYRPGHKADNNRYAVMEPCRCAALAALAIGAAAGRARVSPRP